MTDSCMPADYYINANRCVCCGTILPEGYQYCGACAEHHKLKKGLDTVEVVRCKNCTYANKDGTICHYSVGRDTKPDGYCHCGERKVDNDSL